MARHEEDICARGEMRKQPAFLDDVTDSAAQVQNARRRDRISFELDRPAIGFDQADDQSKQSRFAATARADQHGRFAALEIEIRRVKRKRVTEPFADTGKLNQRASLICHAERRRSISQLIFDRVQQRNTRDSSTAIGMANVRSASTNFAR